MALLVLRIGVRGPCDEAKGIRRAGDASATLNRGGGHPYPRRRPAPIPGSASRDRGWRARVWSLGTRRRRCAGCGSFRCSGAVCLRRSRGAARPGVSGAGFSGPQPWNGRRRGPWDANYRPAGILGRRARRGRRGDCGRALLCGESGSRNRISVNRLGVKLLEGSREADRWGCGARMVHGQRRVSGAEYRRWRGSRNEEEGR